MANPNSVRSEEGISQLIQSDPWHMDVLQRAAELDLPDWWIGAGFLRNLIWDTLESNPPRHSRDVDLVYFNLQNITPEIDWAYDERMNSRYPFADWEIRNQARMHYMNNFAPYSSTADGIAHWVETATCIAVKLEKGRLRYLFCHGTDDLFNLTARPIQTFKTDELLPVFFERIKKKRWQERWPHLSVLAE